MHGCSGSLRLVETDKELSMNYIFDYATEESGRIIVHFKPESKVKCTRKKEIKGESMSMREITQYRTGSYTRKPVTYVVHSPDTKRSSYPEWVDMRHYVTLELRRRILRYSGIKELAEIEGIPDKLVGAIINDEVAERLDTTENKYPKIVGIVELKTKPGVWVVYNLEDDAEYPVIEVVTTRKGKKASLRSMDEYFNGIDTYVQNTVFVIKDHSVAMQKSVMLDHEKCHYLMDITRKRELITYMEKMNNVIEKYISFDKFKTLRRLVIVKDLQFFIDHF